MFEFRFFRGIRAQSRALIAAEEYAEIPLFPSVAATLERLGRLGSAGEPAPTRRELWRESVGAVFPLLVRSACFMALASGLLVASLFAVRHVLTASVPLAATTLLCCAFLAAEVVKDLIYYFDLQRRAQIARGVQLHLFAKVNAKLLSFDRITAPEFSSGNLKTLVAADVESVEDFITSASASWIPALVTLSVTSPAILYLAGWSGAVGIFVTLLQVPVAVFIAKRLEYYKERRQHEQDRLTSVIGEWLRNIRLVRFLGWQESVNDKIAKVLRAFSVEAAKAHFVVCLAFAISYCWWMLPMVSMLAFAELQGASVSVAGYFPAVWFLSLLSNHVQFLPHSLTQYGEAAAAVTRLVTFFNLPDTARNFVRSSSALQQDALGVPVRIHLRNAGLELGGRKVIDSVTVSFDLASHTAIIGEVGSGKSLLLKVLFGEIAPTSGSIEVEFSSGVRAPLWIEEVRTAFRGVIAYAPQEPFLSNTTLRDNIDLTGTHSDQEISSASAKAELVDDIALFPQGVGEEVGEVGINLSGGQKQRTSLSRAFISKRPYLFLDDPLSAVDVRTEQKLFATLLKNCRGFILVSHRLSELAACDRILVLEDGRIIEDDIPAALLARGDSHFRRFLQNLAQEKVEAA